TCKIRCDGQEHKSRQCDGYITWEKRKGHETNDYAGTDGCNNFEKQSNSTCHWDKLKAHKGKQCNGCDYCCSKGTVCDTIPVKAGNDGEDNCTPQRTYKYQHD